MKYGHFIDPWSRTVQVPDHRNPSHRSIHQCDLAIENETNDDVEASFQPIVIDTKRIQDLQEDETTAGAELFFQKHREPDEPFSGTKPVKSS